LFSSRAASTIDAALADRLAPLLAPRLAEEVARRLADQQSELSLAIAATAVRASGVRLAGHEERQGAGPPVLEPLAMALQDIPQALWNVKLLGAELARALHAQHQGKPPPPNPVAIGIAGRLCRQADIESDWLRYWAAACRLAPIYHRKIWETCYLLQALWEQGALTPGRRALGFAVGREPVPSLLTAFGLEVLATDLGLEDPRAAAWSRTNEHGGGVMQIHRRDIVDEATFRARCAFRAVDMNTVPEDLDGQFDLVWSVCSLEHLGSIEKGLAFVERAMACLKPGGVAVHTTEFNLGPGERTVDEWPTVLFRRSDLERLAERLAAQGHRMLPMDYERTGVLDGFIDVPPYGHQLEPGQALPPPGAPHLNLSLDGFRATSAGFIVQAAGPR